MVMTAAGAACVDSRRQIKAVQRLNNNPEKVVEPLNVLCMSLVMGVEPYLRGFDSSRAIPTLVHMAESDRYAYDGEAMMLVFRALSLIMEHVPSSYCILVPYHKRLMRVATQVFARALDGQMEPQSSDMSTLKEESLRLIRFITVDES
ncbi:hypothetical protein, unlikely, partial [Trypanosoma congolense IL3000]